MRDKVKAIRVEYLEALIFFEKTFKKHPVYSKLNLKNRIGS